MTDISDGMLVPHNPMESNAVRNEQPEAQVPGQAGDMPYILALEDGYTAFGYGVPTDDGSPSSSRHSRESESPLAAAGELVFTTAMTGYQETCTDPSYRGQLVMLTYPLINNYGVTDGDAESRQPWLAGLIVREYCPAPSHWRAEGGLAAYLAAERIPLVEGFDTRALTRHLRTYGARRAQLVPADEHLATAARRDPAAWLRGATPGASEAGAALVAAAQRVIPLSEQDLVGQVTIPEAATFADTSWDGWPEPRRATKQYRVVLVDCGIKNNLPRSLARRGLEPVLVPYATTAEAIMALKPDGVLVGNGPGDPEAVEATIETLRTLIGPQGPVVRDRLPLIGVCLGHQLLGLAAGATTSRLKFGHRGVNHPVLDKRTGRVHITSQNHGFQVDSNSLPLDSGFSVSHVNLNDGSAEGLRHRELPIFSVQYHPEASPGPQDNQYLFNEFMDLMEQR